MTEPTAVVIGVGAELGLLGLEVRPLPALDFNIARCYDRLERYPEAIEAYGRFLSGATSPQDRADAPEAIARIRTLKERLKARDHITQVPLRKEAHG